MLNRILASFILLTRLPFWRLREVPAEAFTHVLTYWPLVGWLTGGLMAVVLWGASQVLPTSVAWLLALTARLLATGCLHEDGLADFIDGFGGGRTRERALAIMKDSHIGSYGVVGLIVYFLLLTQAAGIPLSLLCSLAVGADAWGKCCAAQAISPLPYARTESSSKVGVVYRRIEGLEWGINLLLGLVPALLLLPMDIWPALALPILTGFCLNRLMKRRIQGYTGDCCGACFLLCELSAYLAAFILIHCLPSIVQ